ncbi:hypothetical protein NAEGRDRAFT_58973 [Naegleria gruberi]|uniref:Uncharacterized protein n=1 Tax=Naegleria gruberi TaxID=5762 RepID=D2VR02_NAEGR|nr:uncharacterized protein NAEGRDRAFT_58973 [Naegleria gruberi]EFC40725.1 hypothetical protein NAEGRDRAFT_58973 [Naegleria gruberi]|eukprot:XP_002673469.1 hypothetical protein NAEGRDRAFT_58973 [Naegleria gruberi strain NEG-M]
MQQQDDMEPFASERKEKLLSESLYDVEQWANELIDPNTQKRLTPRTFFLDLSIEEGTAIYHTFQQFVLHHRNKFTSTDEKAMKNLEGRIADFLKEHFDGKRVFCRLSTRSPKDASLFEGSHSYEVTKEIMRKQWIRNFYLNRRKTMKEDQSFVYTNEVEDFENYVKNEMKYYEEYLIFMKASQQSLSVSNEKEVLDVLTHSERVLRDLVRALDFPSVYNMKLIFREWCPELSYEYEFRGFIHDFELMGLTQYDNSFKIDDLINNKDEIAQSILNYYNTTVKPLLISKSNDPNSAISKWNGRVIMDFAILQPRGYINSTKKMGNQQTAQLKSRALSSNKILLVAKGIYAIDVPEITNKQMLLALKEGAPKLIKLQIHLRDQVQHPQFTFPLSNDLSFSFNDYHLFLPNLENLASLSIVATLEVPLSQEEQQSSLTSVLSIIGAASDVNQVHLGECILDLRTIRKRDVYNSVTLSLIRNNKVAGKIDVQIVKPGLKIDILELQNSIVSYEHMNGVTINETNLFFKAFDRFVEQTSDVQECRKAKMKVELSAQQWINFHSEERISVVSIDTCHTKSSSGYEMYSCNVWYKYRYEFLQETHQLEQEKEARLLKEAEEAKKKLKPEEVEDDLTDSEASVDDSPTKTTTETTTTTNTTEQADTATTSTTETQEEKKE